jgi:hypothetical protein
MPAALGVSLLLGGLAIALKMALEIETAQVSAIISQVKANQMFPDVSQNPNSFDNAHVVISDVSSVILDDADLNIYGPRRCQSPRIKTETTGVCLVAATDPGQVIDRNSSDTNFVFNSVRPSLTSYRVSARSLKVDSPADQHFVQEFWRSMVSSTVVDRYELYLRRFPSGPLAGVSTARIKELRRGSEEASISEGGAVKKKNGSSQTTKPKTSAKTASTQKAVKSKNTKPKTPVNIAAASAPETLDRCPGGNVDRCRTPLMASEKTCNGTAGSNKTSKACVIHNYQIKTISKRYAR